MKNHLNKIIEFPTIIVPFDNNRHLRYVQLDCNGISVMKTIEKELAESITTS